MIKLRYTNKSTGPQKKLQESFFRRSGHSKACGTVRGKTETMHMPMARYTHSDSKIHSKIHTPKDLRSFSAFTSG